MDEYRGLWMAENGGLMEGCVDGCMCSWIDGGIDD